MHRDAPSLRELQRQVAAAIVAGAAGVPAPLADWLALPPGVDAAARLAVHVEGYPARLLEALREQFAAVAHLAGARRFAALVERYRRGARLASYNLNDAGSELSEFLRGDPLAAALPFLPDLAALEWAVVRAFHAAAPDLDPATLAGADPAAVLARLHPAVAVIASRWPVRTLWEARETPVEQIDVDLTVGEAVLVRRDGFAVVCEPLPAG